jgi:hypothetical protein
MEDSKKKIENDELSLKEILSFFKRFIPFFNWFIINNILVGYFSTALIIIIYSPRIISISPF